MESHCPDLFSVSENGSQFRSNRGLGRGQKRFDQDTPAANGHRREALEPVTRWHLGIGVEPTRQRLEGIGVDAALGDPLEQMPQKRSWVSAPFRNPRKSAGLKTAVLPCSWDPFSSGLSARISSFFQMSPNASGAHQT